MNRPQPAAGARPTGTGRRIVIALLVATAVVHGVLAVRAGGGAPAFVIDVVLAVAALVTAGLMLRRTESSVLLAAAVVGGVGVATFLVPGLVALAGGQAYPGWLDPWAFGALLLDALTVRVAVFTLRRAETGSR